MGHLEDRIKVLEDVIAQFGMKVPSRKSDNVKDRADYIEHGSDKHAQFIGLVEVKAKDDNWTGHTFKSPVSGRTWRLEDDVTPFMNYADPKQVALLVLRQKVSELDAGAPKVPDTAPQLWIPSGYALRQGV